MDDLLIKHKQEIKVLQAEIQRLKHGVPKGDKKKKKEMMIKTAQMEAELEARQEEELQQLAKSLEQGDTVSDNLADLALASGEDASNATNDITDSHGQEPQQKKMSKAEKRRNKKAAKDRAREEEIRQYEIESRLHDPGVQAKIKEKNAIALKLTSRGLRMLEVPSDGDCLYSALSKMLKERHLENNVAELRQLTANHMREHQDDFLPFLCQPNTGDPYSADEYLDYCDRIENTPEWGGQLEIRAMSNVFKLRIEVLQGDAPDVVVGEEYKSSDPLVLTYHRFMYKLGEHYNATMAGVDDAEDST